MWMDLYCKIFFVMNINIKYNYFWKLVMRWVRLFFKILILRLKENVIVFVNNIL